MSKNMPEKIIDKKYLIDNYDELLQISGLTKSNIENALESQNVRNYVLQSTSGSSGSKPLIIPRSFEDITDIGMRVFKQVDKYYKTSTRRIAMFGGISHEEAARHRIVEGIKINSYRTHQLNELIDFNPEIISCYPSILREIIANYSVKIPALKAIKVGGEKLFNNDLIKTFQRFPNILIIEQYGSTELPALATRLFLASTVLSSDFQLERVPYSLHQTRFTFLTPEQDGWYPIIAKDNFNKLLFKIPYFYDSGDDGFWESRKLMVVKRRMDKSQKYYSLIEKLLACGCTNVQINEAEKTIYYSGQISSEIESFQDNEFKRFKSTPKRLKSNKLPLVI